MGQIPPWADLPHELLSTIASFLYSVDILSFRCVCRSWYSSSLSLPITLLSPHLPLRLPRTPGSLRNRYNGSYSSFSVLSATAIYALRPPANLVEDSLSNPNTWLLFVDQLNPGKLSIRKPLTGVSFSMPLDFPRKLNLLDFRVSEIGRYYNLSYGWYSQSGKLLKPNTWSAEVLKVIFLSNGSALVAVSEDGKLGLLRLGVENNVMGAEWEIIHDGRGFRFDDIVEYKGRVLGIDRRGRVYEMGHHFSGMNVIALPIKGGGGRRKRLIESSGILHLAVRCDVYGKGEEMGDIKVYKLHENARRWIEIPSIGDQIFFIGTGFSFSVSTQEFEGFCGKNCIMYEECSFRKYEGGYGDSWLFYGLGQSSLKVGVYHCEDGARLHAIESYSCHSDILWPPPTWIWPNIKSKFFGTTEAAIDRLLRRIHDEHLKAKYKELSSLVGLIVSGESCSQHQMLDIIKETDMLTKFMNEIKLEIEKESKSIKKHLAEDAASREIQRNSMVQSKQVGTSHHGDEGRHGCVHYLPKATEDSNGDDGWLSQEVSRRLLTHFELPKILSAWINVLEEHTNLKDILISRQEDSIISGAANGKMTV